MVMFSATTFLHTFYNKSQCKSKKVHFICIQQTPKLKAYSNIKLILKRKQDRFTICFKNLWNKFLGIFRGLKEGTKKASLLVIGQQIKNRTVEKKYDSKDLIRRYPITHRVYHCECGGARAQACC